MCHPPPRARAAPWPVRVLIYYCPPAATLAPRDARLATADTRRSGTPPWRRARPVPCRCRRAARISKYLAMTTRSEHLDKDTRTHARTLTFMHGLITSGHESSHSTHTPSRLTALLIGTPRTACRGTPHRSCFTRATIITATMAAAAAAAAAARRCVPLARLAITSHTRVASSPRRPPPPAPLPLDWPFE